jgi:hypothetical protein
VAGTGLSTNGWRPDAAGALRRALAGLERRSARLDRLPAWELRVAPLTRDRLSGLHAPLSADGALADALGRGREPGVEPPAPGAARTPPVRPSAPRRRPVVSPAPKQWSAVPPLSAQPAQSVAAARPSVPPTRAARLGAGLPLRLGAPAAASAFRADVTGGGTSAPDPAVPRPPATRSARRPALERLPGATRPGDPQRLPQGTDRYQEPLDDRGDRGSSRGTPTIAAAAAPGSTLQAPASSGDRPQSLAALVRLWPDETAAPDALPLAPEAVSPPVPTEPAPPREAARPTHHAEGRRAADAAPVPELLAVPVAAPLAPAVAEAAYATSPPPVASFAPPIAEAAYATSPPPVATSAASASVTLGPGPAASAPDPRPHRDAALASDDAAPDVEHAVERLLLSELRRHGIELE